MKIFMSNKTLSHFLAALPLQKRLEMVECASKHLWVS